MIFPWASWYDMLCGSKIVVVPIKSNVLQLAGISVCLEAMAFGKPVVITEGASTIDLLPASVAVIVPPEDAQALARAIDGLWRDEKKRDELSCNAKQYAHALGGEERLVRDILAAVVEEIELRQRR
jgi:glycosyltransferase involved in cell wall biosynthesis